MPDVPLTGALPARIARRTAEDLRRARNLRFDLREVPTCGGGLAILYTRESGAIAVDVLTLGADGRATEARVYYDWPA